MTDRPGPDQPRTGPQRREGRRPRPERGRAAQDGAGSETPPATPRALRPDGPSRKPERALARIGDNDPPPIDPVDAPSSDAYRFGDARLIPQRGEAADTDSHLVPEETATPTATATQSWPAGALDTGPSAGSAGTAKALDALSALLARFDDAADLDTVGARVAEPTGESPPEDLVDFAEARSPLDTVTDEPTTDEPVTDEPVTDEPVTDEPVADEPAIGLAPEPADDPEPAAGDVVDIIDAIDITDDAAGTGDVIDAIDITDDAEGAGHVRRHLADLRAESTPATALMERGLDARVVAAIELARVDASPTETSAAPSDGLTPSQRVARDREVRNRLGPAAEDPELATADAATLPPILPAAERPHAATPAFPSKPTRWDRPAPPRDWRYVVGMVGRVLIVTGLLMFGFVAYQLWGTGIATARAQNDLANQFDELVAETAGQPIATTAPPVTGDTSEAGDTSEPDAAPATTEPSGATPTPTIAPNAVPQELPEIELGMALARLEIPRMGKTGGDALIVVPGVDPESLQKGPGHYPDTPLPGQLGNAAIAGHRTTWGEPFADIDQLEPGDEIIVTMITGDRFVYEVASTEIVNPEDYYVVTTTDPTVAELTLTSCHPRFSARQRIAVHAFLKAEESDPVGLPTFYDIEANTAPIAGDDPTVTVPSSTAPAATGDTLDDVTASDTTIDDTTIDGTADDAAPVPGGPGSGPDALTAGWFHDSAAWPHIAAWGIACTAIAIGAYLLSKRFRNLAIGWSAAALPFVVCLYFLYQNVNRLLPPGL